MHQPNTFIVGPPKAATTALGFYLNQHPSVYMCPVNEPAHFCYHDNNPYQWNGGHHAKTRDAYLALFNNATATQDIRCEKTPYYFVMNHCARAICDFDPQSRIVVILRDPVLRAFSMYKYWFQYSPNVRLSLGHFEWLFNTEGLHQEFELNAPFRVGWLKDCGYYYKHLSRFLNCFPAAQIHLIDYYHLTIDPRATLQKLFEFCGIDKQVANEIDVRPVNETTEIGRPLLYKLLYGIGCKSAVSKTARRLISKIHGAYNVRNRIAPLAKCSQSRRLQLTPELHSRLITYYAEDIASLQSCTELDVARWLEPPGETR